MRRPGSRLSRLSIRARITGGSVIIALVISVVAGVVIFNRVQHIVDDGEHDLLESIQAPYRTALLANPAEPLDPAGRGEHVAVVAADGTARVDTLPRALRSRIAELVAAPDGTRDVTAGGVTYLVRVAEVTTSDGSTWHLIAARNGEEQATVLSQVSWLLIVSIALILVGFGAATWLIGTLALRPVTRLRRSAVELAARPGPELLPVGPADDEISRLAHSLNELVVQLRASAERERQLVSDASHELRTPIAILQARLELAQENETEDELRRDVAAAHGTLRRLSALATSLLELSQIEAQSATGAAEYAELAGELADAADRARWRDGGRGARIDFDAESADDLRRVAVPAVDFGRVVDNLVGNALTAAGERPVIVELRLAPREEGAELVVRDDAGGMDPAFVERALSRFARDRPAGSGDGAGLGLAIVDGIARLAGGRVELRNDPGVGLEVAVLFPWRPPAG